jgi:hypothetical protein
MLRLVGAFTALMLSASSVAAQQPQMQRPDSHSAMPRRGHQQMMMRMDSLNARLDSLVDRMNRTSGDQKVQAMAAVITELVSQRRMMQDRMHGMMERGSRMNMMDKPRPMSPAKADSFATDSTDHSGHHPTK